MQPQPPPYDPPALDAFVALAGARLWTARMAEIGRRAAVRAARRTGDPPAPRARTGDRAAARHADPAALRGRTCTPPGWPGDAVTLSRALSAPRQAAAARQAANRARRRRHAGAGVPPAAHRGAAGLARLHGCLRRAGGRCALRPADRAGRHRGGDRLRRRVGRGGPARASRRLVASGRPGRRRPADLARRPSRALPAEDDAAAGPGRPVPWPRCTAASAACCRPVVVATTTTRRAAARSAAAGRDATPTLV